MVPPNYNSNCKAFYTLILKLEKIKCTFGNIVLVFFVRFNKVRKILAGLPQEQDPKKILIQVTKKKRG